MGIARSLVRGIRDKILKNYGEKIVSNLADTSADSPNNFKAPKRDLYDKLKREGALGDDKQDR